MTTQLFGVKVDTLGLVDKGANGEEFFLMKSAEQKESLLDKVVSAVKSAFGQPEIEKEVTMSEDVAKTEVVEKEVTKEESKPEVKVEEKPVEKVEEVKPTPEPVIEVRKEEPNTGLEEEVRELRKRLEVVEIEKSATVYLEKARELPALPVRAEDLAKHLAVIEKAGKETAEYMVALLKAVNAAIVDGGLFKEFGTTQAEANLVEKSSVLIKSGKKDEVVKMLLDMPESEQLAFIEDMRKKVRGTSR